MASKGPGRVAIIGAGPTGLGAAYRLKEIGHRDFVVYEAADRVGGLASSYVDPRGFTWDVGGHVQHSHYKYFDGLMDAALGPNGWLWHERRSWVWTRRRRIPYPFQSNIHRLPAPERDRCVRGLRRLRRRTASAANFKEWVLTTFGEGIAEVFMLPYNRKVWAHALEDLSYSWVRDRVAVASPRKLLEAARRGRDDVSWGPNRLFRFPKSGGTGSIWKRVAQMVGPEAIRLNTRVRAIHAGRRELKLSDGATAGFDLLLNTAPLDSFVRLVEDLPAGLKELAGRLRHSSVDVIGVGLRGRPRQSLKNACWMYFPEDEYPFYRVTVFSNYSAANVPDPSRHWSLMAEASQAGDRPRELKGLPGLTVAGLRRAGLIGNADEVVSLWRHRARYGYPTPTLDLDAILEGVCPVLESLGLYSRGRFGAWRYEVSNQDHCLMQGVEWADRVCAGAQERTLASPARA